MAAIGICNESDISLNLLIIHYDTITYNYNLLGTEKRCIFFWGY